MLLARLPLALVESHGWVLADGATGIFSFKEVRARQAGKMNGQSLLVQSNIPTKKREERVITAEFPWYISSAH